MHVIVYSLFTYFKEEKREWMVLLCVKINKQLKKKENWYFNEMSIVILVKKKLNEGYLSIYIYGVNFIMNITKEIFRK